jgi:cyclophilin family peptidyl-prolyl cis-trans isomerase
MPKRTSSKNKKSKKTTTPKTTKKATTKATTSTKSVPKSTASTKSAAKPVVQKKPETTSKSTSAQKKAPLLDMSNEVIRNRVYAVLFGVLFIALTIGLAFVWIPEVVRNTEDYKLLEEREQQAQDEANRVEELARLDDERVSIIEEENATLTFEDRSATMSTNFGDVVIDLSYDTAPETVENFVRLANRGFYQDQTIHRMVESDGFNVIQGGQAKEGQDSRAAVGDTVVDELWEVTPEFANNEDGSVALANEPVLREPALARDFDPVTGSIVYPKGLILMAKTSAPDSATTQFFVTLTDTQLPAEYTAFGIISEESFAVLDTILNEVNPPESQTPGYADGAPDQEIRYSITLN